MLILVIFITLLFYCKKKKTKLIDKIDEIRLLSVIKIDYFTKTLEIYVFFYI